MTWTVTNKDEMLARPSGVVADSPLQPRAAR